MEYSIEEFQYNSLPQELSDSIIEKENILNGIKHRYAKEVGKVFYEAQQEFSDFNNGGLFEKWYTSIGFKKQNVYNYIQIYNEVQQLDGDQLETFEELPKRLQLEVSKPSHIPELKEKVLDGDIKTHKEYKELEKQLKQRDEEKSQLESQLEQAQRSEEIARKQLEDEQDKEPEVIEKYMEPEDYQSIKNMNEHLQSEREYYKQLADDFRNEVKGMMNQSNNEVSFSKEDDSEDYTPILLKILEPSEVFIQNYKNHLNEQEIVNKLEKIIKKLKEQ